MSENKRVSREGRGRGEGGEKKGRGRGEGEERVKVGVSYEKMYYLPYTSLIPLY